MSQEMVVFGNTVLIGMNKGGTLKPDADGYYTVVLGALDVMNSAGERYTLTDVSRQLFSENGPIHRRGQEGLLKGEWGHPRMEDYPNELLFERRVRKMMEDRIAFSCRKVYLKEIQYMGKTVVGIIGEIFPCGPFGDVLKQMLDDKHQNVCFSGRYYSNLKNINGITHREIHTCAGWDYVTEPGVYFAKKYASPSLESQEIRVDVAVSDNMRLTQGKLEAAYIAEQSKTAGSMSLESGEMSILEVMPEEMASKMKAKYSKKSAYLSW